jgi:hypothetical protein
MPFFQEVCNNLNNLQCYFFSKHAKIPIKIKHVN